MKMSIRLAAVGGAIAIAAFAQPSSAQEFALEEIVVTARKVEENLMEAPLAISAMSAATLEKMNLTEMGEIASFTPGFHYVKQVGGGSGRNDRSASSLVFRGLYLGTLNREQQAGGLVFLDGSPLLGGQAPAMVDMERVEVLKGPQSAYFGRSVLSGAINYVSRNLNDEEFQGRITGSAASFDSSLVQVALEGPIMDGLAVRVSASRDEKGGQYKNFANPDIELGGELTESFVLQVQFRPTDKLAAKLFYQQMEHDDGPPAQAALKGSTGDFNCDLGVECTAITAANCRIPTTFPPVISPATTHWTSKHGPCSWTRSIRPPFSTRVSGPSRVWAARPKTCRCASITTRSPDTRSVR